jgi:hypothetical protein
MNAGKYGLYAFISLADIYNDGLGHGGMFTFERVYGGRQRHKPYTIWIYV